jgi:hypothetical protein
MARPAPVVGSLAVFDENEKGDGLIATAPLIAGPDLPKPCHGRATPDQAAPVPRPREVLTKPAGPSVHR